MPRTLLALLLLPLLFACSSNKVNVDYDSQADFSRFQSYGWLPERSGASQEFDPLTVDRVREALEAELPRTSLKPAAKGQQPDLLVRYFVSTSTKTQSSNTRGSVGMGSSGGSTAVGMSMSFPMGGSKNTREAQIMIDLLDASEEKLKWRGTKTLGLGDQPPEEQTAMIRQVVADILSNYPPGKKK